MIRRRVGLVWLVTVAGTWLITTAVLAVLISERHSHAAAGALLSQASASALLACVVIAGPATAVTLRVRRHFGLGPAALAGLGVAAGVIVFIWSFMAASGAALRGTWGAVTPVMLITIVQLGLALAVRGRARLAGATATGSPRVDHRLEVRPGAELRH